MECFDTPKARVSCVINFPDMSKGKKNAKELHTEVMAALEPLLMCGDDLFQVKNYLDSMFIKAVENADDDEIDNFSARELSPTFKALSETILNLVQIPELREMNSNNFDDLISA